MTWTTPKTWVTGEVLTASDLNTQVRDNLDALKSPPTAQVLLDESADFTTTSTAFVDVDASRLALTITTGGGDVLVSFQGTLYQTHNSYNYLDVGVDGTRFGGDDGLLNVRLLSSAYATAAFNILVTGLAAGSHTFSLQWRVSAGTLKLFAGAGSASMDLHPQFWVREVS